jgi:hypothetical protein
MAKVDNFGLISETLLFKEDLREEIANDRFYMIQIMTRTKDTGEKPKHIRTMFVESREYLMSHKDMIMKLCEIFNARAYISVNASSYKKCAIKMFKELAEVVENENYKGILSLPETLAGKYSAGDNKKWIIDLDGVKTIEECQPFVDFIMNEYNEGRGKVSGEITVVPTVSGSHLLASPFDVRRFKAKWPEIDIHKDSPTLLYYGG